MTDPFDLTGEITSDRKVGPETITEELRRFQKLVPLRLDDAELAHRMIMTPAEIRTLRKLFAGGEEGLKELKINYRVRLLLGQHGIKTVGQLYAKTDAQLLALPGLGPKTLKRLKQATYKTPE